MSKKTKAVLLKFGIFILISVILASTTYAQLQKIYQIGLRLQENSLILDSVVVSNGYPDDLRLQPKQGYFLELKSFENKTLFSRYFDFPQIAAAPPKEWFDRNGRQIYFPNITGQLALKSVLLSIPYFKDGKEIEIYKSNKRVLTIDVSAFSEICNNNGKCDGYEDFRACPKECDSSGKDGYCNSIYNSKCDPDCTSGEDIDCKPPKRKEKARSIWFWTAISGLFAVIVSIIVFIIKWARQKY